jgi:hypothetical protein
MHAQKTIKLDLDCWKKRIGAPVRQVIETDACA